jgi:hypothetical protein
LGNLWVSTIAVKEGIGVGNILEDNLSIGLVSIPKPCIEETGVGKSHCIVESVDNTMGVKVLYNSSFAETLPVRHSDIGANQVQATGA